jgi:hypothetical protein
MMLFALTRAGVEHDRNHFPDLARLRKLAGEPLRPSLSACGGTGLAVWFTGRVDL